MQVFKMENLLKFMLYLFLCFLFVTVVLFIDHKPFIFSPGKVLELYWYIFIALVIAATLLILKLSRIVNNISYRDNSKVLITLVILTVVTITPRLIWVYLFNVNPNPNHDFGLYHVLATEIAQGTLGENSYIAKFPHVIGYPTILSIFYKLFGANVVWAKLLNVLSSCGISILLYFIGRIIKGNKTGVACALIWALWPSQIFYSTLVCTEIVFMFMLLLVYFIFIYARNAVSNIRTLTLLLLLCGVLTAFTNTIRPFGLLMVLALTISCVAIGIKKPFMPNRHSSILFIGVIIIGYVITSSALSTLISHTIKQKTASFPVGFNAYVGQNYSYSGCWNEEDALEFAQIYDNSGRDVQKVHNIFLHKAIDRFFGQKLISFELLINKHDVMWLTDADSLDNTQRSEMDNPTRSLFTTYYSVLVLLSNFYYYIILMLSLFIWIIILNKGKGFSKDIYIFVMTILSVVFLHMILEVSPRYHCPTVPMLAVLCGVGLSAVNEVSLNKRDESPESHFFS